MITLASNTINYRSNIYDLPKIEKELYRQRKKCSDLKVKRDLLIVKRDVKYIKKCFEFMEYKEYAYKCNHYLEHFEGKGKGIKSLYNWLFIQDFNNLGIFVSRIGIYMKIDRTAVYHYIDGYKAYGYEDAENLKKEFEAWKLKNKVKLN
jgi:hypothetical protein